MKHLRKSDENHLRRRATGVDMLQRSQKSFRTHGPNSVQLSSGCWDGWHSEAQACDPPAPVPLHEVATLVTPARFSDGTEPWWPGSGLTPSTPFVLRDDVGVAI